MNINFDLSNISNVEFCVGVVRSAGTDIICVPVDKGVKELLPELLQETFRRLEYDKRTDSPFDKLELAEKYAPNERLAASMLESYMDILRDYTSRENVESSAAIMNDARSIAFYYARFTDKDGKHLFAFRRASSFKAVLRARNRLVQLMNDTLQLVSDNIFKLDEDFDFVITGNDCLILHYIGFEQLAEIQAVVAEKSSAFVGTISERTKFIEKDRLTDYVKDHPRAAKLVAAIHSRGDLERISEKKVKAICKKNGIQLETINGQIAPVAGFEIAFLEVLDRRRYNLSLIEKETEYYLATSRKGVALPTRGAA